MAAVAGIYGISEDRHGKFGDHRHHYVVISIFYHHRYYHSDNMFSYGWYEWKSMKRRYVKDKIELQLSASVW
ncbi:hypothetical protein PV328_000712 [Microctonus aethiopoides]|uniref:Uncharacterized protein n=1 Tax=Microctonus aethiopoides TaxID=144406 RepID=A0AA39FVU2_9HYME|nr:hypothetical protein PV328_000712 [Microctonus aethiopoides]